MLEPVDSWSDVSSWKQNPDEDETDAAEEDEANEGAEESGDWLSTGVTGDELEEESLVVLVQRSLLLLGGSYDDREGFAEVLRGGRREVTAGKAGTVERSEKFESRTRDLLTVQREE